MAHKNKKDKNSITIGMVKTNQEVMKRVDWKNLPKKNRARTAAVLQAAIQYWTEELAKGNVIYFKDLCRITPVTMKGFTVNRVSTALYGPLTYTVPERRRLHIKMQPKMKYKLNPNIPCSYKQEDDRKRDMNVPIDE